MSFAGKVWRLLVGIKDALALLVLLLFFLALYAILSARPSPAEVREGALLLQLDGFVVEEAERVDPLQALLMGAAPVRQYQARDLVTAIDAAADDDRIKVVVLDLGGFMGGGQVHLQDLGAALDRVRKAGKPVLTHSLFYGDDGMLLAAHASEVWLEPMGTAMVAGPGGSILFYKRLIDKLAVNPHIYRVGTFKSAVEPYERTELSPEARENLESLYGSLWAEWQANVKKARPKAELERITSAPAEWIAASDGDLAKAALAGGLVDKLGSRVAFGERVAQIAGKDDWDETPGSYAYTDLDAWLADNEPESEGSPIGVITIAGTIVDGDAGPGTAGGDRIAELLDEALADGDLKGLVVRVDSPGGTTTASEVIREAILRVKGKGIPVAVSMANVAASGGYWVSTPGDRVFAEPETITGSIGIYAVIPSFEGTAEKIGVDPDPIRTTPLSGQPDLIGGISPEMDAILQSSVESGYAKFIGLVAKSRSMTPAAVDRIAQGRVWDGGTARQIGLVDQYGGLDEALAWVAQKAELADGDWHPRFLGAEEQPYDTLLGQLLLAEESQASGSDIFAVVGRQRQALEGRMMADAARLFGPGGAQVYCLECPVQLPGSTSGADRSGWKAWLAALIAS